MTALFHPGARLAWSRGDFRCGNRQAMAGKPEGFSVIFQSFYQVYPSIGTSVIPLFTRRPVWNEKTKCNGNTGILYRRTF